ncbi:hypothetical protein BpHYR1_020750, partial [Brachionus plicatilis]
EARIYARRNTIISNPESSDEEFEASHYHNRRKTTFKPDEDHETKFDYHNRRNTNYQIKEEDETNPYVVTKRNSNFTIEEEKVVK